MSETLELYRKHRPKTFKTVVGQPDAVRVLKIMCETQRVPHALLFTGPSGCGKTTLARILKAKLECSDIDFQEINAADTRGIDMVREIRTRMSLAPVNGKCRIWLIDESHKLTNDAQNSLLKALEDTPKHVYFMLATTDPGKLLKTIITRCTEIKVKEMSPVALRELIKDICTRESLKISEEVEEKIIECALGSARLALVLLNKIVGIEDEADQLDAIERNAENKEAIEIARCLMNPRAQWHEMAKILKSCEAEPESVRWLVLAYMTNVMLGGGKGAARAFLAIEEFRDNFYETKKAGLVRACYAVMHA